MPLGKAKKPGLAFTILFSCILIVLIWFLFNPFRDTTRLEELQYIGPSAGRLMERHMAFYEGYEQTGVIERALHTFLFGSRQQVQDNAINAYEEVLDYLDKHPDTTES